MEEAVAENADVLIDNTKANYWTIKATSGRGRNWMAENYPGKTAITIWMSQVASVIRALRAEGFTLKYEIESSSI